MLSASTPLASHCSGAPLITDDFTPVRVIKSRSRERKTISPYTSVSGFSAFDSPALSSVLQLDFSDVSAYRRGMVQGIACRGFFIPLCTCELLDVCKTSCGCDEYHCGKYRPSSVSSQPVLHCSFTGLRYRDSIREPLPLAMSCRGSQCG